MARHSVDTESFPIWLTVLASILIAAHLGAILIAVLDVKSGPWPTPQGSVTMKDEPRFAHLLNRVVTPNYLQHIKLAHNYHFISNNPRQLGVLVEIRTRDQAGRNLPVILLPDPKANPWVKHRQEMFVQGLAPDMPVRRGPGGDEVPAKDQTVKYLTVFKPDAANMLVLQSIPEHLVPREGPVFTNTPLAGTRARSLARHVCRAPGVAQVEVIRHLREPVAEYLAYKEPPPASVFQDLAVSFGRLRQVGIRDYCSPVSLVGCSTAPLPQSLALAGMMDWNEHILGEWQP